jgi:aerobic-type carbon monoxide dehydrogenase small subunit (CoxS/CutS family)
MKDKKDKSLIQKDKSKKQKKGISRRGFLKGAGVTTAGTVIASSGLIPLSVPKPIEMDKTKGPDAVAVNITVNDRSYKVHAEPRTSLAEVLREHLQLTGTKIGCDRGSCSACTVWLDEVPVNSCMTMILDVGERKVTTIEGLADETKLHPVQQAFIDHDATQCGFCTPGMIMSVTALLEKRPGATLKEIKGAISGNFCRCGTHPNIFNASMEAAKKM